MPAGGELDARLAEFPDDLPFAEEWLMCGHADVRMIAAVRNSAPANGMKCRLP